MKRALILTAVLTATAVAAAGCGDARVAGPVIDPVVKFALRPPASLPAARSSLPRIQAPPAALRLPNVRPRPSPVLPHQVTQAPIDSERVTTFIICDGLGFYLENGYLPTTADWSTLFGGYLLSRVPRYQAEEIAEGFAELVQSPDPFLEAARLSHTLACAAL
jgi:hypothetical protein